MWLKAEPNARILCRLMRSGFGDVRYFDIGIFLFCLCGEGDSLLPDPWRVFPLGRRVLQLQYV